MAKVKTTAAEMDDVVFALIEKVKKGREEIKKLKGKPNWATNCSLSFDPDDKPTERTNIAVVKKPEVILDIYAKILFLEANWKQANQELELDVPPIHQGYAIADWKADLKTRAGQLTIEKKQANLDKLQSRLDALISPDQKRQMELEAIQAEMAAV